MVLQAHWPVPRQVGKDFNMEQLVFSSLPRVLLPPYYTSSRAQRLALKLLRPWQRLFWGSVEKHIAQQLHLHQHGELYPTLAIEQDIFYGGQILESSWYNLLDSQETGSSRNSSTQPGTPWLTSGGGCFGRAKLGSPAAASRAGSAPVAGSAAGKEGIPGNQDNLHVMADSGSSSDRGSSNIDAGSVGTGGAAAPSRQAKQQSVVRSGAGVVSAKVKAVQGMVATFTPSGIRLSTGEHIPADIVVYCTGYTKSYDYLEGSVKVSWGRRG